MCNAPLSHSFLELHNEDILDLLSSAPTTDSTSNREDRRELLQLRENMQGEVVVTNLSQHEIHSAQELGSLLARGALQRATARYCRCRYATFRCLVSTDRHCCVLPFCSSIKLHDTPGSNMLLYDR
jgi:Kinesin motor domain